jgi:hypothetical protein
MYAGWRRVKAFTIPTPPFLKSAISELFLAELHASPLRPTTKPMGELRIRHTRPQFGTSAAEIAAGIVSRIGRIAVLAEFFDSIV